MQPTHPVKRYLALINAKCNVRFPRRPYSQTSFSDCLSTSSETSIFMREAHATYPVSNYSAIIELYIIENNAQNDWKSTTPSFRRRSESSSSQISAQRTRPCFGYCPTAWKRYQLSGFRPYQRSNYPEPVEGPE